MTEEINESTLHRIESGSLVSGPVVAQGQKYAHPLYFHFFTLMLRQSAAYSSATQYAIPQESEESEERSTLTLLSLYPAMCEIQH